MALFQNLATFNSGTKQSLFFFFNDCSRIIPSKPYTMFSCGKSLGLLMKLFPFHYTQMSWCTLHRS